MSLKLNSSGGGSVTLQEPSTASNVTLDLPATAGTVLTSASQFSVNTSAPAGSFVMDSVGRITTPNCPAFRASRSTSFTTTAGVSYEVVYNATVFDVNNNYNSSTGRFTAPLTGVYYFNASLQPTSSGNTVTQYFFLNGAAISYAPVSWLNLPARGDMVMSLVLRMTAGDYISVYVSTGNNMLYDNNGQFSGFLVG